MTSVQLHAYMLKVVASRLQ